MKTFEPNKNATELGIDTTRKFIVVKEDWEECSVWEIAEFIQNENNNYGIFLVKWNKKYIYWKNLYYADNTIVVDWQVYQKVYVSDKSVEDALNKKQESILIYTCPWAKSMKYLNVWPKDIDNFIDWKNYDITAYRYIAEIPLSSPTKKVTVTIDWEQKEIEITEEELNKLLNK